MPVGLTFEDKATFRSRVLVVVGQPIDPAPELELARSDEREAARVLTQRIQAGLRAVTLNFESFDQSRVVERVADVYAEDGRAMPGRAELGERFPLRQAFGEAYTAARERDPERVARVESLVRDYDALLEKRGLRDDQVSARYSKRMSVYYVGSRAVPLGAQRPRPLLLAIHGAFDRPAWPCGSYRGATHGRSFILCPGGVPSAPSGFTLGEPHDTALELRAAITALKARFTKHLARGPVVLAALGPGVDHALALALEEPSFFSHLVLVNGSVARLTPAFATRFGQAGGKRVLCVCSAGSCDADSDLRVQSLRPAGVEARLIVAERGQGLDAAVVETLERQWAWLVSSDSRWR